MSLESPKYTAGVLLRIFGRREVNVQLSPPHFHSEGIIIGHVICRLCPAKAWNET